MNSSTEPCGLGLDLGSSYVKAVLLGADNAVLSCAHGPTGYDFHDAVQAILPAGLAEMPTGVTGYGRHSYSGSMRKTEVACLARGLICHGIGDGIAVDIGGQDCKVVRMEQGHVREHFLNRRCAAGTGSYVEYLAYRLRIEPAQMNEYATQTTATHALNSFCTVFAGTEILDCLRQHVPLPELIRGVYASLAARVREMAPLAAPLYLTGGVIAHHPALREVFEDALDLPVQVAPEPQYVVALGAAILALEAQDDRSV